MGKKNLLPGQKSPIVRSTTAKPIPGLSEAELPTGWQGEGQGLTPSFFPFPFPFAGDGDE